MIRLSIIYFYLFVSIVLVCACGEKENIPKLTAESELQNDTIPFTIVGNHITLDAIIQDSVKAKLVYDTGAGLSLYLDSTFLIKHNWFKSNADANARDHSITYSRWLFDEQLSFRRKELKFSIGKISDTSFKTGFYDLKNIIRDEVDGIVGKGFMSKYVVEINYSKHYLVLHKPKSFKAPIGSASLPVFFSPSDHILFEATYRLENGTSFNYTSGFDLGTGGNVITFETNRLIKKYDLTNQVQNPVHRKDTKGINGNFKTLVGNIKSIEFANITIDTPLIRIMSNDQLKHNPVREIILVGNYIFSRFGTIYIDYAQSKVYLAKIPK